ncbi:MAG: sigma factor-like helix-turn-helix DNA-binding protein [Candidatus Woesearchaeota archaeon]
MRVGKKNNNEINIPLSIFNNRDFSFMESVVFYMKETLNMSYHDIADSLNRDDRTIWTIYNRALKKRGDKR